ncbi:UNVERIFIED_ORG: DNA-binding transcriptional MerR regulator [Paraburkholderia sediminicola]|nr:DNA-binding transcriptional MerR regulator [Paraburkholderia sediminicola]
MRCSIPFLSASEAARQLGVSTKALRLYEQRGLVTPARTVAGYRTYGPDEMSRAAEIVALRALGLSLAQVAQVLKGDPQSLGPALAAHEATLEAGIRQLVETIAKVRGLRSDLARGQAPADGELARLLNPSSEFATAFDLPWPWGGERFELRDIRPLNYIIGPLGSGKTRLAKCLGENIPNAVFLGLERLQDGNAVTVAHLEADAALKSRVDQTLAWLIGEGAAESEALIALLVGLESGGAAALVVDMVEQGLDQATQEALIIHLRQRAKVGGRPLFLMTRSSAILDLAAIGPDESIILCPANHRPPTLVAPYPGTPGYEAVATCLASPEVRARTAGMIAWRPQAA